MSTTVSVNDEAALSAAMDHLRSSESEEQSYLLANHYEGNPNVIALEAQGVGVENLANLLDDTQVQYALVKMQEKFDISTTSKFVYIHWIGEKVPFSKKGRYGVVHGSVRDQFFRPSHCDIETSTSDDISLESINKLINETSGTKSKVIEDSSANALHKRGFTSVPTSQPPKSKGRIIPVSSGGAEVKFDDDVIQSINEVKMDESSTTWVCIGYTDNDVKKPLVCVAKGSGDIDEIKECLADDKPLYFLYRTTDVIDGHVTVKFVYIAWLGEAVKPMAKAKLTTHKGVVQDLFAGCHVSLFTTQPNEITAAIVADKVQSASGSKSNVM